MNMYKKVSGIILAAGYSSRMGAFKPLLPLGEVPVITHTIRTMKQVPLHSILVVIGHQSDQMIPLLKEEAVDWVFNPEYPAGMFSSIQAGIRTLGDSVSGCFLSLVDSPFVPPSVFQVLLKVRSDHPSSLIVPCYRGKKGHPLFIPATLFPEILAYSGEKGLKFITDQHNEEMIRLEVDSETVVMDMDTKEEYDELLRYHLALQVSPSRNIVEGKGNSDRTLYLIRHGETEQQSDKVFIGQWDVSLNELGRNQAKEAAENLLREVPSPRTIYCSDLQRAKETAALIAEAIEQENPIRIVPFPAFRELSLGEWDGLLIKDVKNQCPEDYQKRGEALLSFKIGNTGENFFDLRYRVMKKLNQLIQETTGDLILVAHSGVIKVILSELFCQDLEELMKISIPKGSISKVPISHQQQYDEF